MENSSTSLKQHQPSQSMSDNKKKYWKGIFDELSKRLDLSEIGIAQLNDDRLTNEEKSNICKKCSSLNQSIKKELEQLHNLFIIV